MYADGRPTHPVISLISERNERVNKKRQFPTPREEGMNNIIAAAISLLEEKEPGDITIRDVATASGHHHRLIIEWFGSKGGLMYAVFEKIFNDLIETEELFVDTIALRADVRKVFRFFNYMQMNHLEFIRSKRTLFAINAVETRLREVGGLSEDRARLAARQLAVHTLGLILFSSFFDLTDDEIKAIDRWEIQAILSSDYNPMNSDS